MIELAYPEIEVPGFSGSNNWAISGELSASGRPMLATDPHQPHSIPNTFFYVHLHVEGWDAFGAAFPGVPYFMMGFNNDLAWGLTTGFIDCYDLFVEQVDGEQYLHGEEWKPVVYRKELIEVKGGEDRNIEVKTTHHGVLLEPLMQELGMSHARVNSNQTSLYWSLRDVPSSAGALGLLPTAKTASEFGDLLFEGGVCPLVNNIICVDKENNIGYNTGFNHVKITNSFGEADSIFINSNPYHYKFENQDIKDGWMNYYAVTAYDQGDPDANLESLESSIYSNRVFVFPGKPAANSTEWAGMPTVYPNPYRGQALWDGYGSRNKMVWFRNLPRIAEIRIFSLAGDLVDIIQHDDSYIGQDISNIDDQKTPLMSGGEHAWDLITMHDQATASGLYLFTVEDKNSGKIKEGKFLIIK